MKKKIIALAAIIAVFGLAIAAYAYNRSSNSFADGRVSCCKKDSCPMKAAGHENDAEHAQGEHHKCCGDSCPLKKEASTASAVDHECSCCGDSCPMKKDGETKTTTVSTADGKDCCCCCKAKKDTAV